jgi:hypothetical protein
MDYRYIAECASMLFNLAIYTEFEYAHMLSISSDQTKRPKVYLKSKNDCNGVSKYAANKTNDNELQVFVHTHPVFCSLYNIHDDILRVNRILCIPTIHDLLLVAKHSTNPKMKTEKVISAIVGPNFTCVFHLSDETMDEILNVQNEDDLEACKLKINSFLVDTYEPYILNEISMDRTISNDENNNEKIKVFEHMNLNDQFVQEHECNAIESMFQPIFKLRTKDQTIQTTNNRKKKTQPTSSMKMI